jgi:hypothetical protein
MTMLHIVVHRGLIIQVYELAETPDKDANIV